MLEIRFDKTKDAVALLIWFLVDHSVWAMLSEYSCGVQRVRKAISGKTPSWATGQDRTQNFRKQYKYIVCLNSKFPPSVALCWQNKNISKLGILITKVGNIIIL
jgi:hypothetical protein